MKALIRNNSNKNMMKGKDTGLRWIYHNVYCLVFSKSIEQKTSDNA